MSDVLKKKIVTAGDSDINVITALEELKCLTACLSKSMFHLDEYVNDNLESNSQKKSHTDPDTVAFSVNRLSR